MIRAAVCLLVSLCPVFGQKGPFGFEKGMTKEQVIRLVGSAEVKPSKEPDVVVLQTAPKPHPAFESYMLAISPDQGLLKILASGTDIRTNGFGIAVQDKFNEIRNALTEAYGNPTSSYDYLHGGSLWTDPQYWMMGLLKKERVLAAFWISKTANPGQSDRPLPNDITTIKLEGVALSTEKGYLTLGYEFEGWDAYVDGKKAKENKVF